jgi:hypothetical protein
MYIPSDFGVPILVRALVKLDIITLAAEGRRDDKDDVAYALCPVLPPYVTS